MLQEGKADESGLTPPEGGVAGPVLSEPPTSSGTPTPEPTSRPSTFILRIELEGLLSVHPTTVVVIEETGEEHPYDLEGKTSYEVKGVPKGIYTVEARVGDSVVGSNKVTIKDSDTEVVIDVMSPPLTEAELLTEPPSPPSPSTPPASSQKPSMEELLRLAKENPTELVDMVISLWDETARLDEENGSLHRHNDELNRRLKLKGKAEVSEAGTLGEREKFFPLVDSTKEGQEQPGGSTAGGTAGQDDEFLSGLDPAPATPPPASPASEALAQPARLQSSVWNRELNAMEIVALVVIAIVVGLFISL